MKRCANRKFLDLIQAKICASWCSDGRIFSLKNRICYFQWYFSRTKRKIYILWKNVLIKICKSFRSKRFCILSFFFCITHSLIKKWNLIFDNTVTLFILVWLKIPTILSKVMLSTDNDGRTNRMVKKTHLLVSGSHKTCRQKKDS